MLCDMQHFCPVKLRAAGLVTSTTGPLITGAVQGRSTQCTVSSKRCHVAESISCHLLNSRCRGEALNGLCLWGETHHTLNGLCHADASQSRRHVFWRAYPPKQGSKPSSQIESWSTINPWSFYQISECRVPLNKRKAPSLNPFWRRFWSDCEASDQHARTGPA